MYVVQQPVSVQRTSFHYRWGALKKEGSGNLTLFIFPKETRSATSFRSRQVVKLATTSMFTPSWPSAVCSLDCHTSSCTFFFNCLRNAICVNFSHSVSRCGCNHFCFVLICILVFRDNIKPEKHMLTHRRHGAVHPTDH